MFAENALLNFLRGLSEGYFKNYRNILYRIHMLFRLFLYFLETFSFYSPQKNLWYDMHNVN